MEQLYIQAALFYLKTLPSTTKISDAIKDETIIEVLNSDLANKGIEKIRVLKEPFEFIKKGINEAYIRYCLNKKDDNVNACIEELQAFIERNVT